MTREEARQNLMALGIETPTDAQVTNYLNQFHANRQQQQPPAPIPTPAPVPNPAPNPEPNPQGESELERAMNRINELERENKRKDIAAYATSKGLTGEQVENVLKAFGDDVDVAKGAIDSISQIISDNRAAAAQAKEQELAGNASNPGGGNAGSNNGGAGDERTSAEKLASKLFGGQKQKNDILSHYVGGN